MEGKNELEKAKAGNIVPLYKTMPMTSCAVNYFTKISNYGRKKNSILLESADVITNYGEKSIGSADPCLKVKGKENSFEITSLNETGKRFIAAIKNDFDFCENLKISNEKISGTIPKSKKVLNEEEKLFSKTYADILRIIAFKLTPIYEPFEVYAGLFGAIAYDFIDQFEELPKNKSDLLNEPDFEMNFYDNLFLLDHKKQEITFVANALLFNENDKKNELKRCEKIIENYENALNEKTPIAKKSTNKKLSISTDTKKEEFEKIVSTLQKNVLEGDIFQVVPSRTIISEYSSEPLNIYSELRDLNPSPYMFFFNNSTGILLGSSPETFLKVSGKKQKKVEIRPIAGTKPRGIINGKIDLDLDSRFEAELKNDLKEMAEHTMLIDLARNDVARVCKAGTRHCDKPYMIEKYSHVQHLVSNVSGELKSNYDALHAYLASMNMGTLTGAPKVEAMKLIRQNEKTRRGFYGGSIGYLTPSGNFDSAIVIRSMTLQNNKAYVRAGAGVVYDSIPENEFFETEKKAKACLKAIENAEARE